MRSTPLVLLLSLVLWAGSSQSALAITLTGSVSGGEQVVYRYDPANGQTLFLLTWDTGGSELFLDLFCSLGLEVFGWGTGWGRIDRTARLEVGTIGNIPRCLLIVQSARGSARYTLSAIATHGQNLVKTLDGQITEGPLLTPGNIDDFPGLRAVLTRKVDAIRALDRSSSR
jgi:hypothetical protein